MSIEVAFVADESRWQPIVRRSHTALEGLNGGIHHKIAGLVVK
jgi:hypothetical protein